MLGNGVGLADNPAAEATAFFYQPLTRSFRANLIKFFVYSMVAYHAYAGCQGEYKMKHEITQPWKTSDTLESLSDYYETIRERLESESLGKWAVVANGKLVGVYDSNPEASEVALPLTENGACLVRQIGYRTRVLPLSLQIERVRVHA